MLSLDVAVTSFWKLARHWKQCDKAKLELSCEDRSLHMHLSASLGHPDQPHFPPPPPHAQHPVPRPPAKKKSPSQLRRQERRQLEAQSKAGPKENNPNVDTEKPPHKGMSTDETIKVVVYKAVQDPAVKIVQCSAEESVINFKCDQCDYNHTTEKGLGMHKRMKHRISHLDGIDNSVTKDFEENDINMVSKMFKISVKEKKTVAEVETDLLDTSLKVWEDISGICVIKETDNFNVNVT